MRNLVPAAAFLAAFPAAAAAQDPAPAPRWIAFAADGEARYFYDPASVERDGPRVQVTLRVELDPPSPRGIAAIRLRSEIGCAAQTVFELHFATYDRAGTVVQEQEVPDGRRAGFPIRAGSPEETLYRVLCPADLVRHITPPPRTMQVTPVAPPMVMAPPAPPPPPYVPSGPMPPHPAVRAQWEVPLAALIGEADYPASALRDEVQGRVQVRLGIGADGRVHGCHVVISSGSPVLDSATCRLFTMRARFIPARNERGRPTTDIISAAIDWRLPDEEPAEAAFDPSAPPPPPAAAQPPGEQS